MPKIWILSKDILEISYCKYTKTNFWLVICIVKETLLEHFNSDFSQYLDFYCPILTNHTSLDSFIYLFRWYLNLNLKKIILMTGFVVQGHIYSNIYIYLFF